MLTAEHFHHFRFPCPNSHMEDGRTRAVLLHRALNCQIGPRDV